MHTLLKRNIMFNGPRAGINVNDGFGGGNVVEENLVFNTCRESGDHGPFNTWDRQPFLAYNFDGRASMIPEINHVRHNFLIANYQSQEAVDNDDGSAYWHTYKNFLVYAQNGMNCYFDGHSCLHAENIYAYPQNCAAYNGCHQLPGFNEVYTNNYCVTQGGYIVNTDCTVSDDTKVISYGNQIFTEYGNTSICDMPLEQWQSKGYESGTTISTFPPTKEIIAMARGVLGIMKKH